MITSRLIRRASRCVNAVLEDFARSCKCRRSSNSDFLVTTKRMRSGLACLRQFEVRWTTPRGHARRSIVDERADFARPSRRLDISLARRRPVAELEQKYHVPRRQGAHSRAGQIRIYTRQQAGTTMRSSMRSRRRAASAACI